MVPVSIIRSTVHGPRPPIENALLNGITSVLRLQKRRVMRWCHILQHGLVFGAPVLQRRAQASCTHHTAQRQRVQRHVRKRYVYSQTYVSRKRAWLSRTTILYQGLQQGK
ncbi:hypothetical protein [Samia ricini nucleopolyhedrovirus]|nr:hypothetical protein [Philosamia cynthia ricini nucleopolyhedrovirus virus]BBD51106.1 hypothetical protein [Samia ricini nucleopolyhedrovirus]BBD51258.1 hypothetical protein [Samia ricini nucleopolyhedrovirus]BBD51410.1 hypothetical protein [Samia ricini nucleopolyhedrovirus]